MKLFKYFFQFISIISLFCIFKIIGLKNASRLGGLIGKYIGPFFRSEKIIKRNLEIGLGKIEEKKQKMIIDDMWSNIGQTFAEYVFLKHFRFNNDEQNYVKINGSEYLQQIKNSNESVIFYSGHFANFELMAMELDKAGIKCAAIYRPLNNIFLNPIMEYIRMKFICPNQIPKGRFGMKEVVRKIKNGYSIALMVDQRVSEAPRFPFFNVLAHTTTIPAQLILKYKCKLVPIFIERKKNTNFEITISEPYVFDLTGNSETDTKNITIKINQDIEKMILKKPSQWIWSHNRWK